MVEKTAFPRRKVCGEFISATTWPLLRDARRGGRARSPRAGPRCAASASIAGDDDRPRADARARDADEWGRALGREHLDRCSSSARRERARGCGSRGRCVVRRGARGLARCASRAPRGEAHELRARIVDRRARLVGARRAGDAAAAYRRSASGDLFGFKAHFRGARLPPARCRWWSFRAATAAWCTPIGALSFSCCIRRDALERAGASAIRGSARARRCSRIEDDVPRRARSARGARREGAWLSAGPIRPGIRRLRADGVFAVGNAAGEAHPIIAEGISMAIQSAWLLCVRLLRGARRRSDDALAAARGATTRAHGASISPRAARRRALRRTRHAALHAQARPSRCCAALTAIAHARARAGAARPPLRRRPLEDVMTGRQHVRTPAALLARGLRARARARSIRRAALESLAIDSLALIEIMFAVEDEFGITVPPGARGDPARACRPSAISSPHRPARGEQHATGRRAPP